MKVKSCPKCGNTDLGDRWQTGRKLQQYCRNEDDNCYWKGTPRTPERRRITNTKDLRVDDFYGWDYVVYDKFGHTMTLSRTYSGEPAAKAELDRELLRGVTDVNAGPYTGVLFKTPSRVVLTGKMFRVKKGVVKQTS